MPYRPHRLKVRATRGRKWSRTGHQRPIIVECWCIMVARMDRLTLNRLTRDTFERFDLTDLDSLRPAILRRRRQLAPISP